MSFYKENIPFYIAKLKSMVDKNMEIIVKEVEGDVSEDKYYNVLKGRKTAAEECIWGAKEVDSTYKELDNIPEDEISSYYKEILPELIESLRTMFTLSLQVIDIDLDPFEEDTNILKQASKDIIELLGEQTYKTMLRNSSKSITEDKLHNLIKSRKTAAIDARWALSKIGELETDLKSKGTEETKSWAELSAEDNE